MKHDKTYMHIRGKWHLAETGYVLEHLRRSAVKLTCTGALVARGFPEQLGEPSEVCARCKNPITVHLVTRGNSALAIRHSTHASVASIASIASIAFAKRH